MPSDAENAAFLYAIIKQLDLKSVNWSAIAEQRNVTNGHAARMRFSRLKQQVEGTTSTPRRKNGTNGTSSAQGGKSGKIIAKTENKECGSALKRAVKKEEDSKLSDEDLVKPEPGRSPHEMEQAHANGVKEEPTAAYDPMLAMPDPGFDADTEFETGIADGPRLKQEHPTFPDTSLLDPRLVNHDKALFSPFDGFFSSDSTMAIGPSANDGVKAEQASDDFTLVKEEPDKDT